MTQDILCMSHLRWDFVFQRPHHLLSRAARDSRVFFFEEPVHDEGPPRLEKRFREGVEVVVPHLPPGTYGPEAHRVQQGLLDQLLAEEGVRQFILWYYTPMAIPFTRHLQPVTIVYDCMDELSAFASAPPVLKEREAELLGKADLVFTGGRSLFEAKRHRHPRVHLFPSSVDVAHFARARETRDEPPDQAHIPRPRLGYFGVIDERMDLGLLDAVSRARTQWQLVLLGPTAKIDVSALPQGQNIHYLGSKGYQELPEYLRGWDVALLPFARNEATRFISPTKTPEYLAAGKPVVSTPIRDVVRPYGELGLVRIAETPQEFVEAVECALADDRTDLLEKADAFLAEISWDRTWNGMRALLDESVRSSGVPRGRTLEGSTTPSHDQ